MRTSIQATPSLVRAPAVPPAAGLAAALAAAVLAAGCTGGLGKRSVVPIEGGLALPAGAQKLRIELEHGRVEVRPGPDGEVRFRGAVRRAADTVEQLGQFEARGTDLKLSPDPAEKDVWVLTGPTRPPELDVKIGLLAVELALELPPKLPLQVRIKGSGGLVVEDRTAATDVSTKRGDVRVTRCTGATRVATSYGTVIVYDHRGDLDVETGIGEMQVFVREPGTRLRLVNGAGNIQCYLPATAGFHADARVETGKIANGFGLPIEHPSTYSATMVGRRGDERTEIVLRTGTGHLNLSHKSFD